MMHLTRIVAPATALTVVLGGLTVVPLAGAPLAAAAEATQAPTDGLLVFYDFDETEGDTLTDLAPGAGEQDGTVVGGEAWNHGRMTFTGDNYVRMPDDLLVGATAATIVVEARVSQKSLSKGNFLWNLGGSGDSGTGQFFVHVPGHRAAISPTNWSREQSVRGPNAFVPEVSQSIAVTIAKNAGSSTSTLTFSIDGEQVAVTSSSTVGLADLAVQTNNLIGASAYRDDAKFQGDISAFRLYDRALSEAEVRAVSQADAEASAAETLEGLSLGDLSAVADDLTLPTLGGDVTWTSSDATVITDAGVISPVEGRELDAVLTATVDIRGEVATREFALTLAPAKSADDRAQIDLDAIDLGSLGDVRDSLTLPDTGSVYGAAIEWTSSDPSIITDAAADGKAAGFVTRPAYGDAPATVTLTARVPGSAASRSFVVTVRQLPATEATTAYLFAHFTDGVANQYDNEQIYFATSEDGATWEDLNEESPLLRSDVGEQGVRDPYLVRAPGGDKYYLIATDLSTYRYGWRYTPSNPGSPNLVVWESTDLVSWSEPRLVDVASKIPGVGCAWAPEAIYDEATGQYIVYWASTTSAGASDPLGNQYGDWMNMYYATTRDFVTFSDPVKWIDRNNPVIDTTMIKVGDEYFRASADGPITFERGTDPFATSFSPVATDGGSDGWQVTTTLQGIFGDLHVEGPEIFRYNTAGSTNLRASDRWGIIVDTIGSGYVAFQTTDLGSTATVDNGGAWSTGQSIDFDSLLKRHGTILPVTQTEYARLQQAFGDPTQRITALEVTSPPLRQDYLVGDTLDTDGLVITATTAGGDSRVLGLDEVEVSGFDSSVAGTGTVTVRLAADATITATFEVTITARPVIEPTPDPTPTSGAGEGNPVGASTGTDGLAVTGGTPLFSVFFWAAALFAAGIAGVIARRSGIRRREAANERSGS